MNISEYQATNLSEFICQINQIKKIAEKRTRELWFRGQADKAYDLVPSICRDGRNAKLETELLYRFKAKALPFLTRVPKSDWGWLFLMQHYEIPTRLLDWSEEALIALTFALISRNDKHKGIDAVVWCLEPIGLNNNFNFRSRSLKGLVPNIEETEITSTFAMKTPESINIANSPIAVIGPMNNERIIAQRGTFTLFPPSEINIKLNEGVNVDKYLYRIVIPADKVDILNKELRDIGIKVSNLFPSLESVAKEIANEIQSK